MSDQRPKVQAKKRKASTDSPSSPTAAAGSSSSKRGKRVVSVEDDDKLETPAGRKETVRRRSSKPAVILEAGNRSNCKSFISVHDLEANTAAYVGFTTIGALRRFLVSHDHLQFFYIFDRQWSKALKVWPALEIIRDDFLDRNVVDDFPLDMEQIELHAPEEKEKYTGEERQQRDRHLAHILILMVEMLSGSTDLSPLPFSLEDFTASFLAKHEHATSLPDEPVGEVTRPTLRTQFNESDLEPYNRAATLLRCLSYVAGATRHWASRFESENWDSDVKITETFIPTWMRGAPSPPVAPNPLAELAEAHVPLPALTSIVFWKRGGKSAEAKELEAYLGKDDNDEDLPDSRQVCRNDPRVMSGGEFRDSFRLQYNCAENKLQISSMSMEFNIKHGEGISITHWNLLTGDWEMMMEGLTEAVDKIVTITVRFRCLADEEELMEA